MCILLQPLPPLPESEVTPLPKTRRMQDSYVEMDLPFSSDESLREVYVGGLSKVRMGRLMEVLLFLTVSQPVFQKLTLRCAPRTSTA